jgi:hypothetical protein
VIHLEHQVRIYRPVQEVFAFAGNPANDVHWAAAVLESALLTSGPLRVGSQVRQDSRFLAVRVAGTSTVTMYEEPRRVCLEGTGEQQTGCGCRSSIRPRATSYPNSACARSGGEGRAAELG